MRARIMPAIETTANVSTVRSRIASNPPARTPTEMMPIVFPSMSWIGPYAVMYHSSTTNARSIQCSSWITTRS